MKEQNNKQNVDIASIKTDISWIKEEISSIKDNHLASIYDKINHIEKGLVGRPSWVVTSFITILVGLLSALIVFNLTQ